MFITFNGFHQFHRIVYRERVVRLETQTRTNQTTFTVLTYVGYHLHEKRKKLLVFFTFSIPGYC